MRIHRLDFAAQYTRGIDVLATNKFASRSVTIECKANQAGEKSWTLSEKDEGFTAENHFFVFVLLGGPTERPTFFVVPGAMVSVQIIARHKTWMDKDGKNGPHKPSTMRRFTIDDSAVERFLDRWELLGL